MDVTWRSRSYFGETFVDQGISENCYLWHGSYRQACVLCIKRQQYLNLLWYGYRIKSGQHEAITAKKVDEVVEPVDAMIVTAVMEYEDIKEDLENKLEFSIVSFEEILYETVLE